MGKHNSRMNSVVFSKIRRENYLFRKERSAVGSMVIENDEFCDERVHYRTAPLIINDISK